MSKKWFDRFLGILALLLVMLWAIHMDRMI